MIRSGLCLAWIAAASLIGCGDGGFETQRPPVAAAPLADDQLVIDVVLKDFSGWNDVTFGNRKGLLAAFPTSIDRSTTTSRDVRQLANGAAKDISDDLAERFLERNQKSAAVAPLLAGSSWARIYEPPPDEDPLLRQEPTWAKATGTLSFPGYTADRSKALVQLAHSWSIHSALVTYVLIKRDGTWQILSKDQVVFL